MVNTKTQESFVTVLVEYAFALISIINRINTHAFNNFKMRIGNASRSSLPVIDFKLKLLYVAEYNEKYLELNS